MIFILTLGLCSRCLTVARQTKAKKRLCPWRRSLRFVRSDMFIESTIISFL
jgi:hypothetical protein